MSSEQTRISRNDTARLVRHSNRCGSHRNCIRISIANSLEHETEKLKQCYKLLQERKEFFTEAIFENGTRADILILDTQTAIEIADSESTESLQKKSRIYPVEFEVVRIQKDIRKKMADLAGGGH